MTPFDLVALDRLVAALTRRLRAWRRSGGVAELPALEKEASSKATYDDLRGIDGDPLAPRLALHVAALAIDRVTLPDEARVAAARRAPSDSSAAPGVSVLSASRSMLDPGTDRSARLGELAVVAPTVRDAIRLHIERRREGGRLLGLADLGVIEHAAFAPRDVRALAETALRATDGAFAELAGEPIATLLDRAVAADAGEGWPARITWRWVRDVFGTGPLFDGLVVDPGPLPVALGAASFARALGGVGRELAFADRAPGIPFALARDAFDLLEARRGALFAGVVLEPAFHTRVLGLGPARAREQTRKIARAALVWVRLAALRALAWSAGVVVGAGADDYPDLVERCLGRPLPPDLAAVFPSASPRSALELAAIFSAARDRDGLRDRFDADWFANPRAHEAMRDEHHKARPTERADQTSVEDSALERTLAEALAW